MRGQLAYATPALRQQANVPPGFDMNDELAIAQWDLLIPLADMARLMIKANSAPSNEDRPKADTRCASCCYDNN